MSNASVDRVREDLAVMRQALGKHLPYGPKHVRDSLIGGAVGAAIAAIIGLTGIARLPAVPGSPRNLLYGAVVALPILVLFAVGCFKAFRQRSDRPLDWRESRRGLFAFLLTVPLFIVSIWWSGKHGQSVGTFVNACVIFAGFFWFLGALYDDRYRHFLGWGVATICFGFVMPLGGYQTAGILAGCWLMLGGFSTAAIMAWNLRKEPAHGGD